MTDSRATISVIICAWTMDRWQDLLEAVASVKRQQVQPDEIIVVIDHNDALLARLTETVGDITVIANQHQRGLSGARNTGIRASSGAIVAFMDEDAIAEPAWLARLVAGYAAPEVMGVGGAILPLWQGGRPAWFPSEFDWVVGCTYRGMPEITVAVRNLIGCNMSFRRDVFETVGGFRSGIGRIGWRPVGCEETELCIRAGQHWPARRFVYEPQAQVRHRVPATRASLRYFAARCTAEGLSKALVSRLVGAKDGLASERSYTLRTLPSGVVRGLLSAARGDGGGAARAAMICLGLGLTAGGYGRGKFSERLAAATRQTHDESATIALASE